MRRVLMSADTVGGVWTYALDLGAALAERGVEVTIAAMGSPSQSSSRSGVRVVAAAFKLEWMQAWADVTASGEWLLELERELRPDIVHLNSYAHGALPFAAPRLVVGHSCVCSWFQAVRGHAPPPEWDRYRAEVGRGIRSADRVTAPTRAMLSELRRHYGEFRAAEPIPNGAAEKLAAGEAGKEPFILTVGRFWDEAKNLAGLDAVAPRLSWPVEAIGTCTHPEGGEVRPRQIYLHGSMAREELEIWYRRAAAFALPARYEPFGLAALEAGLAGCALVLGDIPSLREVWGESAVFVPPGHHDALCDSLRRIIADGRLRQELGRQARRQALGYSLSRMARGYLKLYEEMLSAVRPRRRTREVNGQAVAV